MNCGVDRRPTVYLVFMEEPADGPIRSRSTFPRSAARFAGISGRRPGEQRRWEWRLARSARNFDPADAV